MKTKKKHLRIPQNKWTRLGALALALAIVTGLFWSVDRYVGNPVGAWYTEKKLQAHYDAYHPDEGYVVGPAEYQQISSEDRPVYVCRVYRKGSVDTGFSAYFKDGAAITTERAETLSGSNTYNRFHWRLREEVLTKELQKALIQEGLVSSDYDITVDFFSDGNERVFDLSAPVFQVDMEYDPAHLPLPTVLGVSCAREQLDEATVYPLAAGILRDLKRLTEEYGRPVDCYTVLLSGGNSRFLYALDVPAEEIPEPEGEIVREEGDKTQDGPATDPLEEYLRRHAAFCDWNENDAQTGMPVGYPAELMDQLVAVQKSRLLYPGGGRTNFQPCVDHGAA